jgi:hypothetical protein
VVEHLIGVSPFSYLFSCDLKGQCRTYWVGRLGGVKMGHYSQKATSMSNKRQQNEIALYTNMILRFCVHI